MKRVIHDKVASIQFRPDAHHRCVQAVLKDPKLSSDEKRAILSAWASDMYAVESSPMLRMIPGHTTPLQLSEILSALRGLDNDDPPQRGGAAKRMTAAIAPVVYHLARLRREADLRAASIRSHRDTSAATSGFSGPISQIWNVSSLSGDWLKSSLLSVTWRSRARL